MSQSSRQASKVRRVLAWEVPYGRSPCQYNGTNSQSVIHPALRLGDGPGVRGWVVELTRPAAVLSTVDEYEGARYRRVRVTLADGTVAWTYVWTDPFDGMSALSTS